MLSRHRIQSDLAPAVDVLHVLKDAQRPLRGWIRAMADSLGMSGRQLAARLGVKPPRITELEKAEVAGKVTLQSLQRAAEALDCHFVYGFVPKSNLKDTLRRQAERVAVKRLANVSHSMLLEGQGLSPEENRKLLDRRVKDWTENPPRWLWDGP